ncbi:MAG TPA: hypothetical protein VG937_23810 [Polyangiaceae bacterium]|nr:hypothetical protein [Polyangiaceae bacterium]
MNGIAVSGFAVSALLAACGLSIAASRLIARLVRREPLVLGVRAVVAGLSFALLSVGMMVLGALLAAFSAVDSSRGRQLRHRGRTLLAPIRSGAAWSELAMPNSDEVPDGVPDAWRENGRTEHASVASFARLTLELLAVGAPASLVAAANLDGLDEIRHTEACFALAESLDGRAQSPAPFPEAEKASALPRARRYALARLAITSLIDGAIQEGVSARVAAKLSRRAVRPAIAAVLEQIARDEGRHAAHAWDIVEWCLNEGGAPVAFALLGASTYLPAYRPSARREPARVGAWECFGIPGRELELEQYMATRGHAVERVGALVSGSITSLIQGRALSDSRSARAS